MTALKEKLASRLEWMGIPLVSWIINILIPIFGILVLGWGSMEVILLYFYETVIIGIFNIPRLLLARGDEWILAGVDIKKLMALEPVKKGPKSGEVDLEKVSPPYAVFFFILHFGIFLAVLAFFIGFMTPPVTVDAAGFGMLDVLTAATLDAEDRLYFQYSMLVLFMSHFLEFFLGFLRRREFDRFSRAHYWFQPYGRVLLQMMVVGVLGTLLMILSFGNANPKPLAIILVFAKTWADFRKTKWLKNLLTTSLDKRAIAKLFPPQDEP